MEINVLIGVVLVAIVLVSTMPTVANTIVGIAGNGSGIAGLGHTNVTALGAVPAMLLLLPLVFAAVGIMMVIRYVV